MRSTRSPTRTISTARSAACSAALLLLGLGLAGCALAPLRLEVATDCAWAREIRFAAATKAWLRARYDAAGDPRPGTPATLKADLDLIGAHNEKHAALCG